MFDDFLHKLQSLDGATIPVDDTLDDNDYYERVCPSDECRPAFKVRWKDWKDKVSDNSAYCPYCRREAPAADFNTPQQQAHFEAAGLQAIVTYLNGHPMLRIPMPSLAEHTLRQQIVCEACDCHFMVVGAGYFCPACGHNSADRMFDQTIAHLRSGIASLSTITAAVSDMDDAAQLTQLVVEGALKALVTAFQCYAEATYPYLPLPTSAASANVFQRIADGSTLWHMAGGRRYEDILTSSEMADLIRFVQQRHVFEHSQGIVDQKYLHRSGDTTYALGQRMIVREASILRLADVLATLVAGMRADVAESKTQRPPATPN